MDSERERRVSWRWIPRLEGDCLEAVLGSGEEGGFGGSFLFVERGVLRRDGGLESVDGGWNVGIEAAGRRAEAEAADAGVRFGVPGRCGRDMPRPELKAAAAGGAPFGEWSFSGTDSALLCLLRASTSALAFLTSFL